jgi:predicted TIM-barrel fold metal-dependent hydrolase
VGLTRRRFLALTGAAGAFLAGKEALGALGAPPPAPRGPVVDLHVHLFGAGDQGTGCFLGKAQREHVNYRFFRALLGLEENGRADLDYVQVLLRQLDASSLDQAVLLGQDARYDANGVADFEQTPFYVPNDWVFAVCAQRPGRLLPCPSINPSRRDARDELERCAARGARILKIHPPIQAVDPGEKRFAPFYRRCAELGVRVLVHTGPEHAARITGTQHCSPARLATALEEGCIAIAAHSGMANFFDREDFFADLLAMVRRYPRFYCETAVLGSSGRVKTLPRLLAEPEIVARLIHGSDWPFPSNAAVHWWRLRPSQVLRLAAERNLLERDYQLKLALGVPAEVFERGAQVLAP